MAERLFENAPIIRSADDSIGSTPSDEGAYSPLDYTLWLVREREAQIRYDGAKSDETRQQAAGELGAARFALFQIESIAQPHEVAAVKAEVRRADKRHMAARQDL